MRNKKGLLSVISIVIVVVLIVVLLFISGNGSDTSTIKDEFELYEKAIQGDEDAQEKLGIVQSDIDAVFNIKVSSNASLKEFKDKALGSFDIEVVNVEGLGGSDYRVTYKLGHYSLKETHEQVFKNTVNYLTADELDAYVNGAQGSEEKNAAFYKLNETYINLVNELEPKVVEYSIDVKVEDGKIDYFTLDDAQEIYSVLIENAFKKQ